MQLLRSYTILERINLNGEDQLYRAERLNDRQKVIVKIIDHANSSKDEVARISREHEVASGFTCQGIARILELKPSPTQHIAILEDIVGIPLEEYRKEQKLSVGAVIQIAIGLTEILEFLHQSDLVHQDFCPAHLLINPFTLEVKLIDFSITSRSSAPTHSPVEPGYLKRSLAYISPEQTGRIKGEIDIRSDLYALGIILYELIVGKVPFQAEEALTLIHCHIAKSPSPPHASDPRIPVILSDLLLKLLSKNPEDRYQSPFGLKADLQTCLSQWASAGSIDFFELGQHDFSGRLQNPNRFFGREEEKGLLLAAFERVSGGAVETVLIEGFSGIGKSALVHQLKDAVRLHGQLFIAGKFNQFQGNTPYFAFIQAFKEFTDLILVQSPDAIQLWKERILQAVGANGRVLTDVIPHLEWLLGPQPAVPELEPKEAQNRFHYVFLNFISCISQKAHPLVIFFDDLQWADGASMNLLKIIAADKDLQAFLFIGAYRDNEVAADSIFAATVDELQQKGGLVQKIMLHPLPYKNVEDLIQAMLIQEPVDYHALVNLIYDKSQGNPFFINAFLKCLQTENILSFDFITFKWVWDAAKIQQLNYTEDIVELMAGRLRNLPDATQSLLKLAACLGHNFDVQLLTAILQVSRQELADRLQPALEEDLILPLGENYCFTHDRIQQAAYSLIPDAEKKREHVKIGYSLLQNLIKAGPNTYIFEIVNQLNAGIELLATQEEKDQVAALNLAAGLKAKSSAAYKTSFEYLQTGIWLLAPTVWEYNYQLALHLYTEGAESAFLSGNNQLMEEWVPVILLNASTTLDKVRAYEIKIKSYTAQDKLLEAVQTSLPVLELLEVRFPKNPTKLHVLSALLRIKVALWGKTIEDLLHLPLVKDTYAEAAIRVLAHVGAAAYFALPNLFPLIVCKLFSLMVKYGHTPYSGVACAGYGQLMIGGVGNIEAGYRLGKIALQLSEKFEVTSFRSQCMMQVNTYIFPWKEHIGNVLGPLKNNYWYGLETGNIAFAAFAAVAYCFNLFFSSKNLQDVTEEMEKYLQRLKRLKHVGSHHLLSIHTQAALNLVEPVENPIILTGRVHNEPESIQLFADNKGHIGYCNIFIYKLMLAYLFGHYQDAEENARIARQHIKRLMGATYLVTFYFYDSLSKLALVYAEPELSQKKLIREATSSIQKLRKVAHYNPSIANHKLLLVEAELSRVTGQSKKAALLYDNAIEEAKKNEYINDVALSCELAGKFYLSQHHNNIGEHYLLQAYKYYQQWGALAKARILQQNYPYLFEDHLAKENGIQFSFNNLLFPKESTQGLDLPSIMKAATAISSEVQLNKLLKKLVKIAIENAGAQHGFLLLKKEAGFSLEAQGSIEKEEEATALSVPLEGNRFVSEKIIQFVSVTQQILVLDNAVEHPHFSSDPIINRNGTKSVLCMPILYHSEIIGILYLENNLITNAFTAERIELLKLLSGQIAVSIINALNEEKKNLDFLERESLLKKINQQQTLTAKAILRTQADERKRIAEELHDGLGYLLSTLKLNLTALQETNQPGKSDTILSNSKKLLEDSFKELKQVSNNLMPNVLFQFGLVAAVQDLCDKINSTGMLTVRFNTFNTGKKFKKDFEIEVYRIIQEIMNNVVKHAEAHILEIQFINHDDKLSITAEDDGKGFNYEKTIKSNKKGRGLINILNRVNYLNGVIQHDSSPGNGTIVVIELPLAMEVSHCRADCK
jgi:histidine kinase